MKKLISFVLSAALILGSVVSVTPAFAADTALGDVNGDGAVSLADVTSVYRHIYKYETLPADVADINGDDRINALDAAVILKHLLGMDTVIDSELTECPPEEYVSVPEEDVKNGFYLKPASFRDGELVLELYSRNKIDMDVFVWSLYLNYSDGITLDSIDRPDESSLSTSDISENTVKMISCFNNVFPKGDNLVATLNFSVSRKVDISVDPALCDAVNMECENVPADGFAMSGYQWVLGDINGDGKRNLSDASEALKHIAGWYCTCALPDMSSADVNGDDKLNLADVSIMLKFIAGWNS